MIEVIAGLMRHCSKTALPMKPVLPVRMTFILPEMVTISMRLKLKFGSKESRVGLICG